MGQKTWKCLLNFWSISLCGLLSHEGICKTDLRHIRHMSKNFIIVLFMIEKSWKQPKCSTIWDWLYKLWYILEREFYSFIKNDVEIHLLTWNSCQAKNKLWAIWSHFCKKYARIEFYLYINIKGSRICMDYGSLCHFFCFCLYFISFLLLLFR